jgi:Tfp pilus assembly protein PilN
MHDFLQINLLPAEYRVHKRALRLQSEIVYPALFVGAVVVVLSMISTAQRTKVGSVQSEIADLNQKIALNAPIEEEIKKLSAEKKVIVGKIMALERISVNRAKWVRLMEMLCKCRPEYTWLSSVRESAGAPPALVIQGKTRSFPEVATFMADLKQSIFVRAVELAKIEQVNEAEKIFGFEITCTIDPNAGLASVE